MYALGAGPAHLVLKVNVAPKPKSFPTPALGTQKLCVVPLSAVTFMNPHAFFCMSQIQTGGSSKSDRIQEFSINRHYRNKYTNQ